jgi:hypothetical protein
VNLAVICFFSWSGILPGSLKDKIQYTEKMYAKRALKIEISRNSAQLRLHDNSNSVKEIFASRLEKLTILVNKTLRMAVLTANTASIPTLLNYPK